MISLAEQLLPEVRRAMWLDRADAAVAQLESISLRDLRTTVVGATPRDEQGRALLATLREALAGRVAKIRTTWEEEIGHTLEAGRVLQALRLSSRAPDAGARLPSPLAKPLAEAAERGARRHDASGEMARAPGGCRGLARPALGQARGHADRRVRHAEA